MLALHPLIPLLGDYSEAYGDAKNYAFNCPFCFKRIGIADETYKLRISKSTGKWKCFRCDARGSSITHLYERFGETPTYKLVDFESQLSDLLFPEDIVDTTPVPEESVGELQMPAEIQPIYEGGNVSEYLAGRKIYKEHIQYYRLQDCFIKMGQGIVQSVFYPVYENNQLVFWQSRSVQGKIIRNAAGLKKSEYVFNIDHPFQWSVICEGPTSAIRAGYNGLCTFGKSMSDRQLDLLIQRDDDYYFCAFETDYIEKNIELAKTLHKVLGDRVGIIVLPYGLDAADLSWSEFYEYMKNAVRYRDNLQMNMELKSLVNDFRKQQVKNEYVPQSFMESLRNNLAK